MFVVTRAATELYIAAGSDTNNNDDTITSNNKHNHDPIISRIQNHDDWNYSSVSVSMSMMMCVYRVQSTLADNNNRVQSEVFTLNCCHHHHQLLIIRLDTVIGLNCSITMEHSCKVWMSEIRELSKSLSESSWLSVLLQCQDMDDLGLDKHKVLNTIHHKWT